MTDRRMILYSVLNEMLGRRQQCEAALQNADGVDVIIDAHANLCGVVMTIRDIATELLPLDPERDVELAVLRDKYNAELTDLMRTEPTQAERQQYRRMLGLAVAAGGQ
jgi:hypothetical protein